VIIRAVPWDNQRAANAHRLKRATGGRIVWDTRHDSYDTMLCALRFVAAGTPEPAIHLEDDIILTSDWRAKIEAVIAERPDRLIQFFSRRKADETIGSRNCPGRDFLWATCFYVPERMAVPLLDFMATWPGRRLPPTTEMDCAIAAYLASERESYYLHVPSLVQHHHWPSAVRRGRSTNRQSATYVP
jgi:hypothetical protein